MPVHFTATAVQYWMHYCETHRKHSLVEAMRTLHGRPQLTPVFVA